MPHLQFWFWASWKAQQWRIFALSAIYGLAWLCGLWVPLAAACQPER
jgi:hypothetical protein